MSEHKFISAVVSQNLELTSEAMEFLKGVFSTFDADKVWYLLCFNPT